ncbi:GntR family transcriptional regulator [Pedobacter sp. HMWF019]|uniref:rhamnogalacturonan acetylesterase n=1 Tax=Pedobacter sp. HMWF019 TaxID=2056856 RepID=UPI000D33B478|nr:rhamnogalacturonan acetylesterase [Pedobacter sp. HMWF019]PTT01704.1 GntR family transcriptional regulator [Pedobacter sp. HMWF019]
MKRNIYRLGALTAALFLLSFTFPAHKIKIYLIGDSTLSKKEVKAYPETGWGMPFSIFFNQEVEVDNRAKNGRSTKSFLAEGRWTPVADSLQQGDYVFIQFGHNDEAKEKLERYTPIADYKTNLLKFIRETRLKKATPVLITPVSRRKFDAQGQVTETHKGYSEMVKEVAKEENVPVIDLDEKSRKLYQKLGPENSKLLFNQLAPGVHPNYPNGQQDNTHFNELGAREIAQIILAEIKALHLDLANYIVQQPVKK